MSQFISSIRRFLNSNIFLITISLFTVVFWNFDMKVQTIMFGSLLFLLIALFKADMHSVIAIYSMLFMGAKNYNSLPIDLWVIIPISFLLIGNIIFLFNNRYYLKERFKNLIKSKLLLINLLLIIVMLISAINSYNIYKTLSYTGGRALAILFLCLPFIYFDLENFDRKKIAYAVISILITIVLEFSLTFINNYDGSGLSYFVNKENSNLGWAHPNHYLIIANIACAMAIYLLIKDRRILSRIINGLIVLFGVGFNLLLQSRGGVLGLIVLFVSYLIYFIIVRKDIRKRLIIIYSICIGLALCIGLILVLTGIAGEVISKMGSTDFFSGRIELWEQALNNLFEHPIIGVGVGTSHHYISLLPNRIEVNYHNCFMQISQAGFLGIAVFTCYLVLLVKRTKTLDLFSIIIAGIIFMFIIEGQIDTLFFNFRVEPLFMFLLPFMKKSNCYIS